MEKNSYYCAVKLSLILTILLEKKSVDVCIFYKDCSMPVSLADTLVVGTSATALFDLKDADLVFQEKYQEDKDTLLLSIENICWNRWDWFWTIESVCHWLALLELRNIRALPKNEIIWL